MCKWATEEGLFADNKTPGSALAERFRRKALVQLLRGSKEAAGIRFQRRLRAKGSSLAHETKQNLRASRTEVTALPVPEDRSRPWDLSPGKQGLTLGINLHWLCSFLNHTEI